MDRDERPFLPIAKMSAPPVEDESKGIRPLPHEAGKGHTPVLSDLGRLFKPQRNFASYALVGLFLLGFIWFLEFAKQFLLPAVLALVLSFLFKPIVRFLAKRRVPEPIGAALVLAVAMVALANGAGYLKQPAREWLTKLPSSLHLLESKFRKIVGSPHDHTPTHPVYETPPAPPEASTTPPSVSIPSTLTEIVLSYTGSFLAGVIETLVILYFLLASGDMLLRKIVKVMPTTHDKQQAVEIFNEVQHSVSSFLFTITLINIGLGAFVALGLYMVGMPNPLLWGVIAAFLNYIPYFGPVTGVAVLAMAGLLTYESVGAGLIPPVIYLALHTIEANFVTPMILGRKLTLQPLVIFLSITFWMWLWGIAGGVLAVPLLMTLKIFCDHFRSLAPIGELLSD